MAPICALLLLISVTTCSAGPIPDYLKNFVDVFNTYIKEHGLGLDRWYLPFQYDFGEGLPLMSGPSEVRIYRDFKLIEEESWISDDHHNCNLRFYINQTAVTVFNCTTGDELLNFSNCYITVKFVGSTNNSNSMVIRPTFLSVANCTLSNDTYDNRDMYQGLISQALFVEANKYFTVIQNHTTVTTFADLQYMFADVMSTALRKNITSY